MSIRPYLHPAYLRRFVFPWRCWKAIGSHQLVLRKKGSELACQMRELDVSFHVGDGFALLSVGVTIRSAFTWRKALPAGPGRGARIILQRFGPPAFSPLCHCRICGMTRPHSSSIRRVVGGIRTVKKSDQATSRHLFLSRHKGRAFPSTQTRTLVRQLCGLWFRLPRRRDLQARTCCKSLRTKMLPMASD